MVSKPKIKFTTPKNPLNDGIKSSYQAGQYHYLTEKSDWELFTLLENSLKFYITAFDPDGQEVASKIVKHLQENRGTDFIHTGHLAGLMKEHEALNSKFSKIRAAFIAAMDSLFVQGDFTKVRFQDIEKPYFGGLHSLIRGTTLATLIGGTQEIIIRVKDIQYSFERSRALFFGKDTYNATLKITIFDDFGINESDITKYSLATTIAKEQLIALWILNNQRGYKPFRTKFIFNISIHGFF